MSLGSGLVTKNIFVRSYPELSVKPHGECTRRLLEFLDCKRVGV